MFRFSLRLYLFGTAERVLYLIHDRGQRLPLQLLLSRIMDIFVDGFNFDVFRDNEHMT